MNKIKKAALNLTPLLSAMVMSHLLWKHNHLLLTLYILLTVILIFTGKDKKTEFYITLAGIVWGMIIEITGAKISGFHTFNKPDFMGIPLWAAMGWGLGFLVAKRAIIVFVENQPPAAKR